VDRRTTALLRRLGIAAVVGALIYIVLTLVADDPGSADQLASVFGFVLTAVLLLRTELFGGPPLAERIDAAVASLAIEVEAQWSYEARVRGLGRPDDIVPVAWRLAPALMRGQPDGADDVIHALADPELAAFGAAFRSSGQRLVVVGRPGAGKTSLALRLLRAILDDRTAESRTVPVMFAAASWTERGAAADLTTWLAEQLVANYPRVRTLTPEVAHHLVRGRRILPVLDGLDEVDQRYHQQLIRALERSVDGLVLTSRSTEYQHAIEVTHDDDGRVDGTGPLSDAVVVEAVDLSATDVADQIDRRLPPRHGSPQWEAVLVGLRGGRLPALAAVASTPLGLWLLQTVYLDDPRSPRPLLDLVDPARLQDHLFAELVPTLVNRANAAMEPRIAGPPGPWGRRTHTPAQVRRWLTALARRRESRTESWRWWRDLPDQELASPGARTAVGLACGVLLLGPPLVLGFGALGNPLVGLAIAVALGLVIAFSAGRGRDLRAPFVRRRWMVLLAAPVLGLGAGLVGQAIGGGNSGVIGGSGATVVLGAGGLVVAVLGRPDQRAGAASPRSSYRDDRRLAAVGFLAPVLAGGLGVGAVGFVAGGLNGLGADVGGERGLLIGLAAGFLVGVVVCTTLSRWPAAVVSAWLGWLRRALPPPWRLMGALEWCHGLGLLRAVGPTYQFRHAELREHLEGVPAQSRHRVRRAAVVVLVLASLIGYLALVRPGSGFTLDTDTAPRAVALAPHGRLTYTVHPSDDSLLIADAVSGLVEARVGLAGRPTAVSVAADGSRVVVALSRSGDLDHGQVAVVDARSLAVRTVDVGSFVHSVVVSPDGARAYVAGGSPGVLVVDLVGGQVAELPDGPEYAWQLALSEDGRRLFCLDVGRTVEVVDLAGGPSSDRVDIGADPDVLAVSPDGRTLYATDLTTDELLVIDVPSWSLVRRTRTGADSGGIVVSPDGRRVLVVDGDSDSVFVLDAEGTPLATVSIGGHPLAAAVDADGRGYVLSRDRGALFTVLVG
jgi:YVTN family beta-propeller protein